MGQWMGKHRISSKTSFLLFLCFPHSIPQTDRQHCHPRTSAPPSHCNGRVDGWAEEWGCGWVDGWTQPRPSSHRQGPLPACLRNLISSSFFSSSLMILEVVMLTSTPSTTNLRVRFRVLLCSLESWPGGTRRCGFSKGSVAHRERPRPSCPTASAPEDAAACRPPGPALLDLIPCLPSASLQRPGPFTLVPARTERRTRDQSCPL